uniref:Uncharacterized protein n=1 Tax=uncultured Planctomycetales bacterium HF0200_11L05 TaxID=723607 RepID=E7C3U8_9BACT|nr:hypothetical protein [uncultured Planctomycetales bacterium HF0200_11L05]
MKKLSRFIQERHGLVITVKKDISLTRIG